MSHYLICTTPRSGSAWVANFLSSGDCICVHEPLLYAPKVEGYRVVGGIDTGAAYMLEQVRRLPVRLYALTRNADEVRRSLEVLGLPALEFPQLDLPTFEYARLFDVGYLREMWTELNGPGFDAVRAAQLIEMNVQRDIEKMRARLKEKR